MRSIALKAISFAALTASLVWFLYDRGPESLAALLASLTSVIALINNKPSKTTLFFDSNTRQILINHVEHLWIKGGLENTGVTKRLIKVQINQDAINKPEGIEGKLSDKTDLEKKSVLELFKLIGMERSMLITGQPKTGKTTKLLELAQQLSKVARQNDKTPVPIILNLKRWENKGSFLTWLASELNKVYKIPVSSAAYWIKSNKFIFLLDNLSEIRLSDRPKCIKSINQFRHEHGLTPIVVCSRSKDYIEADKKLSFDGAIQLSLNPSNDSFDNLISSTHEFTSFTTYIKSLFIIKKRYSALTQPSGAKKIKHSYVYYIPASIYLAKVTEAIFNVLKTSAWPSAQNFTDKGFTTNFIEWFGVLYGILLPLILVRVWEQLNDIDRKFDREADTVKILYEDIFFLEKHDTESVKEIASSLKNYTAHVLGNYQLEVKRNEVPNNKDASLENDARIRGDKILKDIRRQLKGLIQARVISTNEMEILVPELLERLNDLVDIRGDRISSASQRLFDSLRWVALSTSIIFVLPFYFAGFNEVSGLLDNFLIACVTALVIFIYLLIEDFDEPFEGTWTINHDSWQRLYEEINSDEKIAKVAQKTKSAKINKKLLELHP